MQDIKHITKKRRRGLASLISLRRQASRNSFRRLDTDPPRQRRRLRLLLPLIACLLAAYPIFHLLVSAKNAVSSVSRIVVQSPAPVISGSLDYANSFRLAQESLASARFEGERYLSRKPDGSTVVYAINQELQERVKGMMTQYRVPYGVFVAVEPKSGQILALAAHSDVDPAWETQAVYGLYPMASLFKIVTAASALEEKKVNPQTVVPFRGRLTSENPRYWEARGTRGNQQMDLTTAMGKSANPVFGRLACDVVGKEGILAGMRRFGFGEVLFPGVPLPPSNGAVPQDEAALKLMGAGLCREIKVSPLYVAMMMAGIANKGIMLQPLLASEVRGGNGKLLYEGRTHPLRRLVTPETAAQLSQMMSTTVSHGTSRKVFRDRRGRPKLAAVDIAAKTGSINGTDPPGHYNWFAAYAPIDDPQIALVALIVNGDKWRIKASYMGEQALEAFFR